MARPSRARELLLWMNGQRVGAWRIPARGNMELVDDAAWRVIGDGLNPLDRRQARLATAMQGKNRHDLLNDIQRRHFNAMTRRCGIGDNAEPLIQRILARAAQALAQVESEIPAGFPGQVAETFTAP